MTINLFDLHPRVFARMYELPLVCILIRFMQNASNWKFFRIRCPTFRSASPPQARFDAQNDQKSANVPGSAVSVMLKSLVGVWYLSLLSPQRSPSQSTVYLVEKHEEVLSHPPQILNRYILTPSLFLQDIGNYSLDMFWAHCIYFDRVSFSTGHHKATLMFWAYTVLLHDTIATMTNSTKQVTHLPRRSPANRRWWTLQQAALEPASSF